MEGEGEGVGMKLPEAEIIALYRAGKTHEQIAAAIGVSRSTVGACLLRNIPEAERYARASAAKSAGVKRACVDNGQPTFERDDPAEVEQRKRVVLAEARARRAAEKTDVVPAGARLPIVYRVGVQL